MAAPLTVQATEPVTLLVAALGGEGGGVLAQWLVDVARACGHSAQATSIPGVAQRTGATTYYLEFCPLPDSALGGAEPLFSLSPVPGGVDVLLASELLEATRQASLGFVDAARTRVLTAGDRTLTVAERSHGADGRVDNARLLKALQAHAQELLVLDMAALAQAQGTIVSAVMLGALAASGALPFARAAYEQVVGAGGGRAAQASLRGVAAGWQQVQALRQALDTLPAAGPGPTAQGAAEPGFPPPVQPVLAAALPRLRDYQDERYAQLYLQRLQGVLQAEQTADPAGAGGWALTREAARLLALWMTFDDIARVADLKSRASRWQRVRHEQGVAAGDLLALYDHFKPGVPELADLLPPAAAQRLRAWDQRRQQRGLPAWGLALKLPSHSARGLLPLRALAALKHLRRSGQRYADEQATLTRWLAAVQQATREHWALGLAAVQLARLIKGYGSTHARGRARFEQALALLAQAQGSADERSQALRRLVDDAQARPEAGLPAQPIRFVRRRPAPAR
jgi:indolepyruvate ferredoxin oxidoreductase beta subunit